MPQALERGVVGRDAPGTARRSEMIARLWRRYKRDGSDDARGALVEHYMRTHVRRLAERLHASLPRHVDLDDLVQQGYLGLAEALERFDLERDVTFETFSSRRIFGAMRDYLRAIDPLPRLARSRARRVEAEIEAHRKRFGRPPTDADLRHALDLSVQRFIQASDARHRGVVHLGSVGAETGDDGCALDGLPDNEQTSPLSAAERDDLRHWISRGFSRRDHLILILYYYEHLTMREVGQALGISESRVSQRLESIIACLRSKLCWRGAEGEFY